MKPIAMTPEKLEKAISMREGGTSIPRIAQLIGVSIGTVAYHFLKEGVEPPKIVYQSKKSPERPVVMNRGKHQVRLFTVDEDKKLLEMSLQGMSISEMARALGRRHNSIKGRLMCLARRDERAAC